jgi:hypothetical protein
MQRIMIVSDSHRRHGNLAEAIYNEQPFDLLIHLGDIEGEEDIIQELAGGETIMVPGNNDFFSPLPREREIELAGKKVLLTHGHYYYVSLGRGEKKSLLPGTIIVSPPASSCIISSSPSISPRWISKSNGCSLYIASARLPCLLCESLTIIILCIKPPE